VEEESVKYRDLSLTCQLLELFLTIHSLLKLLASFTVSIASAERSFSALKRVKTWLRCNMLQERLNGLAIIHCHRDQHIDIDQVIDIFSKNKRKKDFII
jgi:hypothetical protein